MTAKWSRTILWCVTALALVAGLPATPVHAQAETGAPVLDLSLTARSQAMGMSGVADRSDPGNVYFNPACVTAAKGVWMTGAREKLLPGFQNDIWFGHVNAGGGYTIGDGSILVAAGLTMTRLSYGENDIRNSGGTVVGTVESHEDVVGMTGGVAGTLGERAQWAFGVAVKRADLEYVPEVFSPDPEPLEASGWMVDVGAVASTDVDASDWSVHPALGVAAVNMGSDLEFDDVDESDPLPTWFNYGVSVRVDAPDVSLGANDIPVLCATLNLDGRHGLNEQRPRWAFGYELALVQCLFARWGRVTDDRYHQALRTWGLGLGAPIGPVRVRAEYTNTDPSSGGFSRDLYGVTAMWLFDRDAD